MSCGQSLYAAAWTLGSSLACVGEHAIAQRVARQEWNRRGSSCGNVPALCGVEEDKQSVFFDWTAHRAPADVALYFRPSNAIKVVEERIGSHPARAIVPASISMESIRAAFGHQLYLRTAD